MSLTTANPTTLAPAILDHDAPGTTGDRRRSRWFWALVESLAYAGAAFDPAAALAAQRLARIRDQELRPRR